MCQEECDDEDKEHPHLRIDGIISCNNLVTFGSNGEKKISRKSSINVHSVIRTMNSACIAFDI